MARLYVVATPIGNLEDITLRALRVLRSVGLIAAEDTRTTRKLLTHYDIHTPLTSYTDHNAHVKTPLLLRELETRDVALVSEAGMPGISDPGRTLVAAAHDAGIPVVPVPGPSALPTALAVSGLPSHQALFLGFLPARTAERRRLLNQVAPLPFTLVIFEAPHRLQERLLELRDILGERRVAVCRELTKLHEEIFRGTLTEALDHFDEPRGEFVLVIEGGLKGALQHEEGSAGLALAALRRAGWSAREAVAEVAHRFNLPRRMVYDLWVQEVRKVEGHKTSRKDGRLR